MSIVDKQKVLAHLARIKAGLPVDAQVILSQTFEAHGTGGRTALRQAYKAVQKAFKFDRKTKAWGKRDTADTAAEPDGDEGPIIICRGCASIQPMMACHACATPGPGAYCPSCGISQLYNCPGCGVYYAPVDIEPDEVDDGLRCMPAIVEGTRTENGITRVTLCINAAVKDDYGTYIMPEDVFPLIDGTRTKIDVNHDFMEVPGSSIENVHLAEKPWTNPDTHETKPIKCVFMDYVFDTKVPAKPLADGRVPVSAAAAVEGFRTGKYTGGSVHYIHPKSEADAIRAGKTNVIRPLEIRWATCATKPSNSLATVAGIRCSRADGSCAVETKPTIDPTEAAIVKMRELAGATGGETKPTDPPAPPATEAGGRTAAESAALLTRLDSAVTAVEALNAASRLEGLETGSRAALAEVQELRGLLQEARETIGKVSKLLSEVITLHNESVQGVRTQMATREDLTALRTHVDSLTVAGPRRGTSGAEQEDGVRTDPKPDAEEQRRAELLRQADQMARICANAMGR